MPTIFHTIEKQQCFIFAKKTGPTFAFGETRFENGGEDIVLTEMIIYQ